MAIERLLATVFTADLDKARDFYAAILARSPDRSPMPDLVEWDVGDGGGLQVFRSADRAGAGSITISVDNLEDLKDRLSNEGLVLGEIGKFDTAYLLQTKDPDGNDVVLAEQFS